MLAGNGRPTTIPDWGRRWPITRCFRLRPLLVIAIRIAGLFFGEDAVRGKVVEQLKEFVGTDSAKAIQALVEYAGDAKSEGWTTVLTFGVLIVGSLSVFLHVRGALCTIWKLTPPSGSTILDFFLNYLLALIMVVCTGVLLLVSLAASVLMPIVQKWIDVNFPHNGIPWQLVEIAISILLLTLLFMALFRILSGQRIPWRFVIYGSVITAILFSVGKVAVGFYLAYTRHGIRLRRRRLAGGLFDLGLLFVADFVFRRGACPGPAHATRVDERVTCA